MERREVRTGRFIPTYVGNSSWWRPRAHVPSVHPHVCGELERLDPETIEDVSSSPHARGGELIAGSGGFCATYGSSPHTWGTLAGGDEVVDDLWFIPTYVGNSNTTPSTGSPRTVHPHIRGELVQYHSFSRITVGSSPHTWGTQLRVRGQEIGCRFIPTYVENSSIYRRLKPD